MSLLATFIHISDLHIGPIDPRTGDAVLPASARLLTFGIFDGLWGHRSLALMDLQDFYTKQLKLHKSGLPPRLLVTGDLTSFGSHDQFASAEAFIKAELVIPFGLRWGLREATWLSHTHLGNHDQWGGIPVPVSAHPAGKEPPLWRRMHNDLPSVSPSIPLPDGRHALRFIRVDTDRDVGAHSGPRLKAWGSFVSQITSLKTDPIHKLNPSLPQGEVRVMLLHHSRLHNGLLLCMDDASKRQLDQFVRDYKIPVILTGHCHDQHVQPHTIAGMANSPSTEILEARCGTTTRRDKLPKLFRFRRVAPNTLLVHTVESAPGNRLIWKVQKYGPNGSLPDVRFTAYDKPIVWPL